MNSINDNSAAASRRIVVFLAFLYMLTFVYEYIFVVRFLQANSMYSIASVSSRVAFAMFIPSICVVLTRLCTGEGFNNLFLSFDMKNGKWRYYVLAWFLPGILTILGSIIYFELFRGEYSPSMDYIIETYRKQGAEYSSDDMRNIMISQTSAALLIGPIINCLTCFGEEWGFRGYLLPKLREKLSLFPLLLANGIIWGLWHLPLIVMGHNYGVDYPTAPYGGILAMCVFCIVVGCFFTYITVKTDSCIPAVIAHGALNSICSLGIFFTKNGGNSFVGPMPTGIIGGLPFIVTAVVCVVLMKKDNEAKK